MFFILKNVLVFFGGCSPERDISVITGVLTLKSLDENQYQAIPIYVDGESSFFTGEALANIDFYKNPDFEKLKRCALISGSNELYQLRGKRLKRICEVDCAINCLHGQMGEDGTLSGILIHSQIPEVAPNLFAQAISIDKDFTKMAVSSLNVRTVDGVRVLRDEFFKEGNDTIDKVEKQLGFPIIVKPARLGSSIGIERADNKDQLFIAIVRAFRYDDKVICERYIKNSRDINCAVYKVGDKLRLSKLEEPLKKSEILSFQDKYGGGKLSNSKKTSPDDLPTEIREKISEYAQKIYERLEFSSIVRFDFLVSKGEVYLNEINAIPGSLAYYLFSEKLSDFAKLLDLLIKDCIRKHSKRSSLQTKFESNVLKGDWSSIKK